MRIVRKSKGRLGLGLFRFALLKLVKMGAVRGSWFGMVDSQCQIFVDRPHGLLQLGKRISIGRRSTLQATGQLSIGDRTFINHDVRIICHDRIVIGSHCLLAPYVSVLDHDHFCDFKDGKLRRDIMIKKPVEIGDHVWIGEKTTLLKGVSIGKNSVIGANSVVTKSFPENSVIAGNPAKQVRSLTDE